jgi:hypothetical protein
MANYFPADDVCFPEWMLLKEGLLEGLLLSYLYDACGDDGRYMGQVSKVILRNLCSGDVASDNPLTLFCKMKLWGRFDFDSFVEHMSQYRAEATGDK